MFYHLLSPKVTFYPRIQLGRLLLYCCHPTRRYPSFRSEIRCSGRRHIADTGFLDQDGKLAPPLGHAGDLRDGFRSLTLTLIFPEKLPFLV